MGRLELLHRPGCHLCEVMRDQVQALCANRPVTLGLVDVDQDAALRRDYGNDIPVLLADGRELCRHRLDEAELLDYLARL